MESQARQCGVCLEFSIPASRSKFIHTCQQCYGKPLRDEYAAKVGFRKCAQCTLHVIAGEEPKWKTVCLECFKSNKRAETLNGGRRCSKCSAYNISLTAPTAVKLCSECSVIKDGVACKDCGLKLISKAEAYRKTLCAGCWSNKCKNETDLSAKRCEECNAYVIPLGAVDKTCADCLVKIGFRECASCHQENIPSNEPKWKKLCFECNECKTCSDCGEKVKGRSALCDNCRTSGCVERACSQCGTPLEADSPLWMLKCSECRSDSLLSGL